MMDILDLLDYILNFLNTQMKQCQGVEKPWKSCIHIQIIRALASECIMQQKKSNTQNSLFSNAHYFMIIDSNHPFMLLLLNCIAVYNIV